MIAVVALASWYFVYAAALAVFHPGSATAPLVHAAEDITDTTEDELDSADVLTHVVQPNETVTEIAEEYGLRTDTILWANDITASSPIQPGQELKILPFNGLLYTTASGDSLGSIANRFDASVQDIAEVNKVDTDAGLSVGTELIIPRSFARGSYLLARGGRDEVTIEFDTDEPQVAGTSTDSANESESTTTQPARSGWVHPAPGAVITQGAHGVSGGVDFGAPVGTTVVASDGGTVIKASAGYNGGYGTMVEIDHHDGTTSLYAHLSTTLVSSGQTVTPGQSLGYIGMTGKTSGPHLHFEIHGGSNPFASCGYLSRCGG